MSIIKFDDYREFLKKHIMKLPQRGRGEIQRISSFIGIHPSLLSQVLSNAKKNLSLEQAQLLSKYLGLTSAEHEFLFCSVQLQRAGTAELKKYFREKLEAQRVSQQELIKQVRLDRELSLAETAIYYSHWHYAAIWLSTSLKGGRSLDEIASSFKISRDRAQEILQFLQETQLCRVEAGRYHMGPQSLHLGRTSPFLVRHLTNWRLRAVEASHALDADEMMYSGPLSISKADFKKLRVRLGELVKEMAEVVMQSDPEDIACINLDLFWIRK